MNNNEYEKDKCAYYLNPRRRKDLIVLAKLRMSKGTYYKCLKHIYGVYCMHCGDLEEQIAIKKIKAFGKYMDMRECDIHSQINSYKGIRAKYLVNNSNPYTFSNSTLIKELKITKDEQQYLHSIREYSNPNISEIKESLEQNNKFIKREIEKFDDSLNNTAEERVQDIEEEECPFIEEDEENQKLEQSNKNVEDMLLNVDSKCSVPWGDDDVASDTEKDFSDDDAGFDPNEWFE